MKINCNQFEGLITFYLNNELSDKLRLAFEEHLHNCPSCHIRFNMLSSIIKDLKDAYKQVTNENNDSLPESINNEDDTNIKNSELSAYIDNELNDENCIKVRKNIIAKPTLRKKLENMYKLRKIITNSFEDYKNKTRVDYSKDIIKSLNKTNKDTQIYFHCIAFMMFLALLIGFSIWIIINTV